VDSNELRQGRLAAELTQVKAAARLGVSQPYLSQLENGQRQVTARLARAAARLYRLPPTVLPVSAHAPSAKTDTDGFARQLAALGYPGYGHLRPSRPVNPARVVAEALSEGNLDARVAEALPWVLLQYAELDWGWLVSQAKLRNVQNRLGFVVGVSRELAESRPKRAFAAARLKEVEGNLERARLAAETTLSRETMPQAEREWLRVNRTPLARHWNVLASLSSERLPYGS
jgi:transcriptional regulator with XRE-family HTH domain